LHSPKYQKFLTDKLPIIKPFIKQDWQLWNEYYRLRYGKAVKPVKPHKGKQRTVPTDTVCPLCGAPHEYIYDNSGGRGQFKCKICGQTFVTGRKWCPLSDFSALTVVIHSSLLKTENTSASI